MYKWVLFTGLVGAVLCAGGQASATWYSQSAHVGHCSASPNGGPGSCGATVAPQPDGSVCVSIGGGSTGSAISYWENDITLLSNTLNQAFGGSHYVRITQQGSGTGCSGFVTGWIIAKNADGSIYATSQPGTTYYEVFPFTGYLSVPQIWLPNNWGGNLQALEYLSASRSNGSGICSGVTTCLVNVGVGS